MTNQGRQCGRFRDSRDAVMKRSAAVVLLAAFCVSCSNDAERPAALQSNQGGIGGAGGTHDSGGLGSGGRSGNSGGTADAAADVASDVPVEGAPEAPADAPPDARDAGPGGYRPFRCRLECCGESSTCQSVCRDPVEQELCIAAGGACVFGVDGARCCVQSCTRMCFDAVQQQACRDQGGECVREPGGPGAWCEVPLCPLWGCDAGGEPPKCRCQDPT